MEGELNVLSAFKNFGITFLIALIIFGVGGYFATSFVTSTMSSILSSEREKLGNIIDNGNESGLLPGDDTDNPGSQYGQIDGESFSFLLVVTNYRPDLYGDYLPDDVQKLNEKSWNLTSSYESLGYLSKNYRSDGASVIMLVRADKESGQYTYTYFSPESRVYTPTGYHTLGEVYSYYGVDTLTDHINALTGIKPTYKLIINGYNLDELVTLLGPVTVNLSKDIYSDGFEYTTIYETAQSVVGADGVPYTENVSNTYVLGTGAVEVNSENIYILSSLKEKSMSDITMKEAYSVEMVRRYIEKLAAMDAEQLRIVISQLTLNESEWVGIEGLDYQPPAETEETEPETEEVNPWWTPPEDNGNGGEADESGESDDESDEEEIELFEPETPIFETSFTAAELSKISGVIKAVSVFENITVPYPGSYVSAGGTGTSNGTEKPYFEPDLKIGIERFLSYRKSKSSDKSGVVNTPSTVTPEQTLPNGGAETVPDSTGDNSGSGGSAETN